MPTEPSQVLVLNDAEIEHDPTHLSPKAIAAAVAGIALAVILNVAVLVLTGELPVETVLPTTLTALGAAIAAYIKREILPELAVPIPEDTTLIEDDAVDEVVPITSDTQVAPPAVYAVQESRDRKTIPVKAQRR